MGFVVACIIIVLNVVIITKSIQVAKGIKDEAGSYVAAGICGIFLFSYIRKHRNDDGVITNYRCAFVVCKLWAEAQ